MSAFAGYVSLHGEGVPFGTLERLAAALRGRGLAAPRLLRQSGAVFACRLRQATALGRFPVRPPRDAAGLVSLFDGRIDNAAELAEALGQMASGPAPVPDAEVALAAYRRWGEEAPSRLLGDFAWAVWDGPARRLLLSRDHGVLRSLFFARGDGFVAFATGYRPLLALPQVPREIDEVAVADLLMTSTDPGDRSFYKGIAWVGSATTVACTASGTRQGRYWEPGDRPTQRLRGDREYLEAAREVFDAAVAARLDAAGPVVVSVSGGLDSSAVAATAARLRAPGGVRGLCAVPAPGTVVRLEPPWYADERPLVSDLAAMHPNLDVEYACSLEPAPLETDPAAFFLQAGMPLRSSNNAGWFMGLYRRAAELGAGTMLTGDWGNATFSYDGLSGLSVLRERGRWLRLAAELAALRSAEPARRWWGILRHQARHALPFGLGDALAGLLRRGPTLARRGFAINPDFARELGLDARLAAHGVSALDVRGTAGQANFMRYLCQNSRMQVEGLAALRDLTGVTVSDPFSDRRVLEFCLSLPPDRFLRGGVTRRLAREAFADRLPPSITDNPGRGAQGTDWHLRLTPLRGRYEAELARLERSPLAGRVLDLAYLRAILASWPRDATEAGRNGAAYRVTFTRALHVGQFLCWLEGNNG